MLMTSLMTSQEIIKIASLYSLHFSSVPKPTFKRHISIGNNGIQINITAKYYLQVFYMIYHFWPWLSKVKVTRSPNDLFIKMTITQSIFKLEHRSKAQNFGNGTGYLDVRLQFRYHFRFERSPEPQNGGHLEFSHNLLIAQIWL